MKEESTKKQEDIIFGTEYLSRMLENALHFHRTGIKKNNIEVIPEKFNSVYEAKKYFHSALTFEAGMTMSSPLNIDMTIHQANKKNILLHAIDLDTNPSIVSSVSENTISIHTFSDNNLEDDNMTKSKIKDKKTTDLQVEKAIKKIESYNSKQIEKRDVREKKEEEKTDINDRKKVLRKEKKRLEKLIINCDDFEQCDKYVEEIEEIIKELESLTGSLTRSVPGKTKKERKDMINNNGEKELFLNTESKTRTQGDVSELENTVNKKENSISNTIHDTVGQENVSHDTVGQENVSHETVGQENVSHDTVGQENVSRDTVGQENAITPTNINDENLLERLAEEFDKEKTSGVNTSSNTSGVNTSSNTSGINTSSNTSGINTSSNISGVNTSSKLQKVEVSIDDFVKMKKTIFPSPVPFAIHIDALNNCEPNPVISRILCGNSNTDKYNDCVKVFYGPPGTGKTWHLIKELKKLVESTATEMFYVCAGSNIGVINMYNRAVKEGIPCKLTMNLSKLPKNTHVEKQKRTKKSDRERVVFATISSRYNYENKHKKFRTIIIDEGAQVQEALVWGLLRPEVYRIIIAGDPQQLNSIVSVEGERANHGRSIMERLISLNHPTEYLKTQRRMHSEIAYLPNKYFYDNKLLTDFIPSNRIEPSLNNLKPFDIIHTTSPEKRVGTSFANKGEADKIFETISSWDNQNIIGNATCIIISPYSAQCKILTELFSGMKKVEIHTVDSFQGHEADIVFLTIVRSTQDIGFWKDTRRLCVAMTRAKHVFRIVGSQDAWDSIIRNF